MSEIYRGRDREKTEFIIMTPKKKHENMLHLVVDDGTVNKYVFECTETYNQQTQWSVTKCKAVLKAIMNGRVKLLYVNGKMAEYCVVGKHDKEGKEYCWNIPPRGRKRKKIKVGKWVLVDTKNGVRMVKVIKVIPTVACTEKPLRNVVGVRKMKSPLLTKDEKKAMWQKRREEKRKEGLKNEERKNTNR